MSLPNQPLTESTFSKVSSGTAYWDLQYEDRTVNAKIPYAYNDYQTELLLVTGFGETYIDDIAAELGKHGLSAAVCSLEYPDEVRLTPSVLEATIIKGLSAVISSVNLRASRPESTPMDLVGHSIGFAEVAKFAIECPELCRQISGSAPFGINNELDRKEIKNRLKASGLLVTVLDHPNAERLAAEFTAGSAYIRTQPSVVSILELYRSGMLNKIVIGKNDQICPPDECKKLLNIDQLIDVTEGGHDPLSSSVGIKQLLHAVRLMRTAIQQVEIEP
jgi:predicted alpha/beta hydrolase family esterase